MSEMNRTFTRERVFGVISAIILIGFPVIAFTQIVNIIDLHKNDANGLPAAPYALGTQVTVEGIATVATGVYSTGNFEIYLQDPTAGINVFVYNSVPLPVRRGDLVRVTGKIQQYKGLTEISDLTDIKVLSHGNAVPEPLTLTCQQVDRAFQSDYSEPNEGRLIRINGVEIVNSSTYTFTLRDASGTCTLYIDPDTHLSPPQGTFDVIGILKQYDGSEPYTGGYEISPRVASDFIGQTNDAPVFVQKPHEVSIGSRGVSFSWETDIPATSLFRYGLTNQYERGAIGDSTLSTSHNLGISGLQPATIYQAQVTATSADGKSRSVDFFFSTASEESSGEIKAYFTHSVDAAYADSERANGNTDLSSIIINRIDHTNYTLDVCYYSFTHVNIAFAIKRAKERGVRVRMIYESENESDEIRFLRDVVAIPMINDTFGANTGYGAMHDKFIICDNRDKSTGADDWLWVGSANATYYGSHDNAENMLLIQDEALCNAYTREFDEMWGSSTDEPNADQSRFGNRKLDNTPHRFNIKGTWIEQYMSPSDNTEQHLIDVIEQAQKSIYFCILAFTSDNISAAMQRRYYSIPDFWLRGVFESENTQAPGSEYPKMSGSSSNAWSMPADVHSDIIPTLLHHKYMIIDAALPDAQQIVVTGSHNFTVSANTRNDENDLIIYSNRVANLYLQEFAARYRESGGQGDIVTSVATPRSTDKDSPSTFRLAQNYPNPFNASTIIPLSGNPFSVADQRDQLTLTITDILGRIVQTINLTTNDLERQYVLWDGKDARGVILPSGLYFAQMHGTFASNTVKMVYLR